MNTPIVAADSKRGTAGWGPWTGVLFVALFLAAEIVVGSTPNDGDSDSAWTSFFADRGNRILVTISGFLLVFAAISLLAFLTFLWLRIRTVRAQEINPLPLLLATMAAIGIAFSGLVQATITGAMVFGSLKEPGVDVLRLSLEMSYPILLIGGMYPAALGIAVLAFQAHPAGVFAKWVLILSDVVAVGLLASVLFFPLILLLVWVLVVAVLLLRSDSRPAAAVASSAAEVTAG